jgi:hypothetical protein
MKMEVKNILSILASVAGFFLLVLSPTKDLIANLMILLPFLLIFILRLLHFMLMQYSRLSESIHQGINFITLILSVVIIIGLFFAKFIAIYTPLNIVPFGYYILVATMAVTCLILSIFIVLTKFSDKLNIGVTMNTEA